MEITFQIKYNDFLNRWENHSNYRMPFLLHCELKEQGKFEEFKKSYEETDKIIKNLTESLNKISTLSSIG